MAQHVRILGGLYLAFGILSALLALGLLGLLGGVAGIVNMAAEDYDARIAVPILLAVGTFLFGLFALLAVPEIVCGVGLLSFRPWARIVGIVLSALALLKFPIGTALGVYGLWVLTHEETRRLFGGLPPAAAVR